MRRPTPRRLRRYEHAAFSWRSSSDGLNRIQLESCDFGGGVDTPLGLCSQGGNRLQARAGTDRDDALTAFDDAAFERLAHADDGGRAFGTREDAFLPCDRTDFFDRLFGLDRDGAAAVPAQD